MVDSSSQPWLNEDMSTTDIAEARRLVDEALDALQVLTRSSGAGVVARATAHLNVERAVEALYEALKSA